MNRTLIWRRRDVYYGYWSQRIYGQKLGGYFGSHTRDGKDKSHGLTSDLKILSYDIDTDPVLLDSYCQQADFVCHLAGVNRPKDTVEYMEGNFGFTSTLLEALIRLRNNAPVLITSSIQATLDNPYGQSKKAGEDLMFDYSRKMGVPVYVYRLPNAFGKWSRPNYNSAIATFCYNIARGLPITITDREISLNLVYIDDIVAEIIRAKGRTSMLIHSVKCDRYTKRL